jgi:hypothetical protein
MDDEPSQDERAQDPTPAGIAPAPSPPGPSPDAEWMPPPAVATADPSSPTASTSRVPRRWPGRVVVALTVLALVGAGLSYLGARQADDRATAARRATVRLAATRRHVAADVERVSHTADGPIGVAEKVSSSVSRILGTTGPVIEAANSAQDRLSQAVDVANGGNIGAASALYAGSVAGAIRGLQALLTDAQNALTTARTAALELAGQSQ